MIVTNQSNVKYSYTIPGEPTQSGEEYSNPVDTEILSSAISKVKTSRQTVVITNNSGVALQNVTFKDVMTDGATYVSGSVEVNGVSQPSYDLITGFPLPDIPAGGSVSVSYTIIADDPLTTTPVTNYATITYTVNDPNRGPVTYSENTNDVSIDVVSVRMTNVKSVDKGVAVSGETLHYTSVITNAGTVDKTDITFIDPIPAGTTFVPGSVRINGTVYPAYNPDAGFALPDLAAGESVTVEFDVTVN